MTAPTNPTTPAHAERFWVHDSTCCRYLESRQIGQDKFDAYYCLQGGNLPTLLLRYGADGHEYMSSQLDFALVQDSVYDTRRLPPHELEEWRLRRDWIMEMKERYDLKTRKDLRA